MSTGLATRGRVSGGVSAATAGRITLYSVVVPIVTGFGVIVKFLSRARFFKPSKRVS